MSRREASEAQHRPGYDLTLRTDGPSHVDHASDPADESYLRVYKDGQPLRLNLEPNMPAGVEPDSAADPKRKTRETAGGLAGEVCCAHAQHHERFDRGAPLFDGVLVAEIAVKLIQDHVLTRRRRVDVFGVGIRVLSCPTHLHQIIFVDAKPEGRSVAGAGIEDHAWIRSRDVRLNPKRHAGAITGKRSEVKAQWLRLGRFLTRENRRKCDNNQSNHAQFPECHASIPIRESAFLVSGSRIDCLPLIVGWLPRLVRVVTLHLLDDRKRVGAQVFLVDDPIVANDESLDSSDAVFHRDRNQSESPDHDALDDVVELAESRCRTLSLQDFEIVAVVSRALFGRIAFLDRASHSLAHRSTGRAIGVLPVQAIMFSWGAEDLLRILVDPGIIVDFGGVFLLRLDIATTYLDGVEFVGADAPVQNLIVALLCIEAPLRALFDDGNREGPIVVSDGNGGSRFVLRVHVDGQLFLSLGRKFLGIILVAYWIARRHEIFAIRPENLHQHGDVVLSGGLDEGVGGLLWGVKQLLCWRRCGFLRLLGWRIEGAAEGAKQNANQKG